LSDKSLTVELADGTTWLVRVVEVSDGVLALQASPAAEAPPTEPNVYWDTAARNFDEVPDELPTKVRTVVYQWMRNYS
jgi:hypothetical protein